MTTTFESFRRKALDDGFSEALERHWPADTVLDAHSHPFHADAVVVQGEMWLTVDGRTRHLLPGDRFEIAAQVPHGERYGAQGATYWVARR